LSTIYRHDAAIDCGPQEPQSQTED